MYTHLRCYELVVMLELADMGVFSRELVVEKMCHAPARLYNIDRRGYLRSGYYADLVNPGYAEDNAIHVRAPKYQQHRRYKRDVR